MSRPEPNYCLFELGLYLNLPKQPQDLPQGNFPGLMMQNQQEKEKEIEEEKDKGKEVKRRRAIARQIGFEYFISQLY